MADFIFKMRMLRMFIRQSIDDWREQVWKRDLDSVYCCDGRECCCGGSSVREVFTHG